MKNRLPLTIFFASVALIVLLGFIFGGRTQPSSSSAPTTTDSAVATDFTGTPTTDFGFETDVFGTTPTSTTLAPSNEVVVTAPDGTPLTGSDVPDFESPDTGGFSPNDPDFTPGDDNVYRDPNDLYDVAESFVREYFTLLPNETAGAWKVRVSPFTTLQFLGRQSYDLLDQGQPQWALVEEAIEGTGFADETRARITVWYKLSDVQPEDIGPTHDILPDLSVQLVLVRFPDGGWRVTSLY